MLIFDLNMFIPFVNGVKLQKVWLSIKTHIWCFLVEKLNWKSKIAYLSAFMVKMGSISEKYDFLVIFTIFEIWAKLIELESESDISPFYIEPDSECSGWEGPPQSFALFNLYRYTKFWWYHRRTGRPEVLVSISYFQTTCFKSKLIWPSHHWSGAFKEISTSSHWHNRPGWQELYESEKERDFRQLLQRIFLEVQK